MFKVCGQYSIKLMLRHTKFPLTHSFTLIKAYAEKLKATLDSQEVRNIIFLYIDVSHYENVVLIFFFPNRQLNKNQNIYIKYSIIMRWSSFCNKQRNNKFGKSMIRKCRVSTLRIGYMRFSLLHCISFCFVPYVYVGP